MEHSTAWRPAKFRVANHRAEPREQPRGNREQPRGRQRASDDFDASKAVVKPRNECESYAEYAAQFESAWHHCELQRMRTEIDAADDTYWASPDNCERADAFAAYYDAKYNADDADDDALSEDTPEKAEARRREMMEYQESGDEFEDADERDETKNDQLPDQLDAQSDAPVDELPDEPLGEEPEEEQPEEEQPEKEQPEEEQPEERPIPPWKRARYNPKDKAATWDASGWDEASWAPTPTWGKRDWRGSGHAQFANDK